MSILNHAVKEHASWLGRFGWTACTLNQKVCEHPWQTVCFIDGSGRNNQLMIGQIRCDIVLIEEFAKATVMFGMERSFTLKRFRIRVAGAVAAGEMMKITQ